MQAADALARNFRKEHSLRLLLECFCYGRCFSAAQLARAAVYSYPSLPDIAAILAVVVEDAAGRGERRAVFAHHAERLREGAARAARARAAALAAGGGGGGGAVGSAALAAAAAAAPPPLAAIGLQAAPTPA